MVSTLTKGLLVAASYSQSKPEEHALPRRPLHRHRPYQREARLGQERDCLKDEGGGGPKARGGRQGRRSRALLR